MDQAKKTRTSAKMQYTLARKSLANAISVPDIPIPTVERRRQDFQNKWQAVQDAHCSYAGFEEEMESGEATKLEEWIGELADDFDEMEIKADRKVEAMKPKESVKPREDDGKKLSAASTSAVKLERMKFPQFEGNIRQYPQFKEEFIKHVSPLYREEQLAFVLKSYLVERVREEAEACGEDYAAIWKRLDQRFGDRGKIVNEILDEVTHLPSGESDDSFALTMIKVVEKAHRDLQRLNAEQEMYNATMIVTIEKRMSIAMRQEWAKEIAGKDLTSAQKFLTLLSCLETWRCRIEYLSDSVRSVPPVPVKSHQANHLREERPRGNYRGDSNRPVLKCWIHQLDHPVFRCREFLAHSIENRVKLVEQYKACKVCLNTDCPGVQSPQSCNRWTNLKCLIDGCQELHSRWLHPAKSISGTSAHTEGGAVTGSDTILQTQSLTTSAGPGGERGARVRVNTFWDSGSTLCFITNRKAADLRLKGKPISLSLVTVGGKTTQLESYEYSLIIYD